MSYSQLADIRQAAGQDSTAAYGTIRKTQPTPHRQMVGEYQSGHLSLVDYRLKITSDNSCFDRDEVGRPEALGTGPGHTFCYYKCRHDPFTIRGDSVIANAA
jgi:hypothetical protein